jgi:hypothetical protein
MEMKPYVVYVKIDDSGYITAVNSSAFLADTTGWTEIDSGSGDRYHHAQTGYFPQRIYTDGNAYRYKLVDGKPVECTPEEIAEQEEKNKPNPIAPRNVMEGEYITVNGVMYKATTNIPNGATIITGQNAVATTVEEQLYEMTKGE